MTPTIDELINGMPNLGSYTGVLNELEEVVSDPQNTLADVCAVIEKDPALTARLLKLGNSSFFGFSSRVETVFETISLIGIQQVRDLIATTAVMKLFEGVSADQVDMESFWRHSLACGVTARVLAITGRFPKPEKFFVAGLLHDVGRLVLFSRAPRQAGEVFQHYERKRILLRNAEKEVLGYDHAQIGAALLRAWNYPPILIDAVCCHHQTASAGVFQTEACLVHLADHLVNAMQLGCGGERFVPPLDMKSWERLNLTADALESIVTSVDDQVMAVEQAFLKSNSESS